MCTMEKLLWVSVFLLVLPVFAKSVEFLKNEFTDEGITDKLYFDVTKALDGVLKEKNDNFTSVIAHSLKLSRNVYYSTDLLVSELAKLKNITDLLDSNDPNLLDGEEGPVSKSKIALSVRYNLPSQRVLGDIFYDVDLQEYQEAHSTFLRDLKSRLVGVIQEWHWNSTEYNCTDSDCSNSEYFLTTPNSFVGSAKVILKSLLGLHEFEMQFPHPFLRIDVTSVNASIKANFLQREMLEANGHVKLVTLEPGITFPLSFEMLRLHPDFESFQYLSEGVYLKLQIHYHPENEVVRQEAGDMYEYLLRRFADQWIESRSGFGVRVLKGDVVVIQNLREDFIRVEVPSNKTNIPYLFTHDKALTPCALLEYLKTIFSKFDTLVINEYIWTALVRSRKYFADPLQECEHILTADKIDPAYASATPNNLMLFVGEGSENAWRLLEGNLKTQIAKLHQIHNMRIQSIVLTSGDIDYLHEKKYLALGGKIVFPGMNISTAPDLGCIIKLGEIEKVKPSNIKDVVLGRLAETSEVAKNYSSFIVLQIKVDFWNTNPTDFTYYNSSTKSFSNYHLLGLLRSRESIQKKYPRKRVILQIVSKPNSAASTTDETGNEGLHCNNQKQTDAGGTRQLQQLILTWAEIHKFPVILKPAVDLEKRSNGLWTEIKLSNYNLREIAKELPELMDWSFPGETVSSNWSYKGNNPCIRRQRLLVESEELSYGFSVNSEDFRIGYHTPLNLIYGLNKKLAMIDFRLRGNFTYFSNLVQGYRNQYELREYMRDHKPAPNLFIQLPLELSNRYNSSDGDYEQNLVTLESEIKELKTKVPSFDINILQAFPSLLEYEPKYLFTVPLEGLYIESWDVSNFPNNETQNGIMRMMRLGNELEIKMGIELKDCPFFLYKRQINALSDFEMESLWPHMNFTICSYETTGVNVADHLFIKRKFQKWFPHVTVYFRVIKYESDMAAFAKLYDILYLDAASP